LVHVIAVCGAGVFLCGCPNPNTYTTPRTLDPGKWQFTVAAEALGYSYNAYTTTTNGASTNVGSASGFVPMVPSFIARVGVADGFDLGIHASNLDSLGLDGKIRLVKGTFDLALDPGVQGYYYSFGTGSTSESLGVVYFHAPVMLGVNFSQDVSLVLTPGFVYGLATASVSSSNATQNASGASGAIARGSVGLDIRVSPKLALHPEVTVMKSFENAETLLYIVGFGFNIGAQPDFSDLGPGGAGGGGTPPTGATQ
jgi:hypothetical protein